MPRLAFSKYLLAASSALALTLSASVAARASNVVANPVDPIPPIAAGHTVSAVVFNDGVTRMGGVVNNGTIAGNSVGVVVTNGTVLGGGIVNNGTIATRDQAILLFNGILGNGIVNGGAISSGASAIVITQSKLNGAGTAGSIVNSGTISAKNGAGVVLSNAALAIGVTQEASADVKIFVNYDAQIQSSFASHTISAGIRVRFN